MLWSPDVVPEESVPERMRAGPADRGRYTPHRLPGVDEIRAQTAGDGRVCVAVLDGPVDLSHPSLRGANLQQMDGLVPGEPDGGPATRHGTLIASVIFGRPDSQSPGIAPGCCGVAVPIFESGEGDAIRPCSQLDLARALTRAVLAGAQVINVSGGQFAPGGAAHPLLAEVVAYCARQGVLIVAAAGNEGCDCLHVPAALEPVLAVGAMDGRGEPMRFSNWGGAYQTRGVLAPGDLLQETTPRGARAPVGGTSYATAVASGVAGLLLSWQLRRGQRPDPHRVREAILAGARESLSSRVRDADPRYLSGPLNVRGALSFLTRGIRTMAESGEIIASDLPANRVTGGAAIEAPPAAPAAGPGEAAGPRAEAKPAEKPAGCGCGARTPPSLVYALGQIGFDFHTEARLDSFAQKMAARAGARSPDRSIAFDPRRLLAYLESNPWDAAALEWTLTLEGTPLYAIRPTGPFAAEGYKMLQRFLREQIEEGVERVSVPGVAVGKSTLLNGQTVPTLIPDLRGMYSWTTKALVDAVAGADVVTDGSVEAGRNGHGARQGVSNFLTRVYHEVRNLGLTPQDRALNYAATNAFEIREVYADAIRERMELDQVTVVPSAVCRPGSDCWDVQVCFFYPERHVQTVRKVYRFTVDVSDTVPVTVGVMRSWFTR
jgi:hypothetical protein